MHSIRQTNDKKSYILFIYLFDRLRLSGLRSINVEAYGRTNRGLGTYLGLGAGNI